MVRILINAEFYLSKACALLYFWDLHPLEAPMAISQDVRAVILAGGSGTRLWPLSRLQSPKQFSRLIGDETLLDATIARLHPVVEKAHVLVVTSEGTATGEGYRILEPFEKLLEPVARNTASAIGVAALRYRLEGIDPVMVILPSDHLIRDIPAFQAALATAIEAAAEGRLVTFGIEPTMPETGFGYIEAEGDTSVIQVTSFREKPDRPTAQAFLASGRYYWNSGMFVWKASAILAEIAKALPELKRTLDVIEAAAGDVAGLPAAIKKHFAEAPSISIDHGVLEKSRNIFMIRGRFGWSDVGSWDAVYDVSEKDGDQNALQGNVVAIECRNSLIRSHSRLVAAVGVEDISVVETRDAVLITRRGSSQRVGEIVKELVRRSATEHILHVTVQRPWGSYTVVEEGHGFKMKRIEVRPGGRLSMQRHRHRSEHWVVVAGEATVTCDEQLKTLRPNESTYIPAGIRHRLENLTTAPVEIIEVQVGSYLGEDDIERFDDEYGRVEPAYGESAVRLK
jgi:mannose-1-phosphate guanylyltransferase/mannose-6-phosphate isomerase